MRMAGRLCICIEKAPYRADVSGDERDTPFSYVRNLSSLLQLGKMPAGRNRMPTLYAQSKMKMISKKYNNELHPPSVQTARLPG